MPTGAGSLLVLLLSFVVTFTLARICAKWFWCRRREKEDAVARANESRQVRRARERRR